jgi:hypothetical protein
MKRQSLVELFCNIYYSCTVYTDELEVRSLAEENSERCNTLNIVLNATLNCVCQVKIKVILRLTVSQSANLGVEPHLGLMTRYLLLFWQLRSCFRGAPSLTRGRVCLLYMLLALASAVFLGSESRDSDHILPSQIWDFPFRRLLRLAGSRWRYSTPPPRGSVSVCWMYVYFLI